MAHPPAAAPAHQARGGTAHQVAGHLLISYHIGDYPAGPLLPADGPPGLSDCESCGQRAVPGCRRRGQDRKGMTHVGTVTLGKLTPGEHATTVCGCTDDRQGRSQCRDPAAAQNAPSREPSASVSGVTTRMAGIGPCYMAPHSPSGPRTCGRHGHMHPRACRLGRHRASGQQGRTEDMGAHAVLTPRSPAQRRASGTRSGLGHPAFGPCQLAY